MISDKEAIREFNYRMAQWNLLWERRRMLTKMGCRNAEYLSAEDTEWALKHMLMSMEVS